MSERDQRRALVVVPTYNEAESIGRLAREVIEATRGEVDLLVVDDGSPNGTARLVEELAKHHPSIHLLERQSKQGLGPAYKAGFAWAAERGYAAVVEMDADLSHNPSDVPRLLVALEDADLAIGSRYVPGGGTRNWGLGRRALSRLGNIYARMWLRFGVRDSTSGFRAYRTEALKSADLDAVTSRGYSFQVEMTRLMANAGCTIVEVPITFVARGEGKSKMSHRIVLEALRSVAEWGIHDRRARRRSRTKES